MDLKEITKAHLSLIQGLQQFSTKYPLKFHFINLYLSALANIQTFFGFLLNSLKNTHDVPTESLKNFQRTLELMNNQAEILKKIDSQGFFFSFGLNTENKDSLHFLYKSTNEILEILEKSRYYEQKKQTLSIVKISEKELEMSLSYLDEEVLKSRKIREKTQLEFNASTRQIQNDLAYVFFVKQLESSGNYRKRLIKRLEFITGFQKFIREFEPGNAVSNEQLWIIEKKLGMKENLTASKIDEFFNEIWGNVNERVKILGYKKSSYEFHNRGLTEYFERKISNNSPKEDKLAESKREIEDLAIEEEKHEPKQILKKEPSSGGDKKCSIY